MAITKCKECKKEVSDKAKLCPHCGVKNPGFGAKQAITSFITLGILVYAGWYFIADHDDSKKVTAPKTCGVNDEECLFNLNFIDASTPCRKLVEKSAKFEYEWTDGVLSPMFSRYTYNQKSQTITYIGDKIKFANGFNAKSTMTYACTYDLQKKKVIDFGIEQGKL